MSWKDFLSECTLLSLALTSSLQNYENIVLFSEPSGPLCFCYQSLSRLRHMPLVIPEFYLTCAPKGLKSLKEDCN